MLLGFPRGCIFHIFLSFISFFCIIWSFVLLQCVDRHPKAHLAPCIFVFASRCNFRTPHDLFYLTCWYLLHLSSLWHTDTINWQQAGSNLCFFGSDESVKHLNQTNKIRSLAKQNVVKSFISNYFVLWVKIGIKVWLIAQCHLIKLTVFLFSLK